MEESRLTCHSCGQHFETKSDLQDHERTCQGVGMGKGQTQGKTQNPSQSQSKQKQPGDRTRTAGGGGSEESGT